MRLIDLFRIALLLSSCQLFAHGRIREQEDSPSSFNSSQIQKTKDISPESLLGDQSRLVHSVFRILREQVSAINSLVNNLNQRRSLRAKKDHPEVLNSISLSISEVKSSMSNVLREVKACKRLLKAALPHVSSNPSTVIAAVDESNILLKKSITEVFESINTFMSRLEEQRTGLYSRKQKLRDVIEDIPERLQASILKLDDVLRELSQISEFTLELEGRSSN